MQDDPTGDAQSDDRFCATCGEPIGPEDEAADVYRPAEGEVTIRLVHVGCMRPGEEVA
jgi:hypothetical protein